MGEGHEDLGRTYLRVREIGTFTSDTPYLMIRDLIDETLKLEQLRDQRMLDVVKGQ